MNTAKFNSALFLVLFWLLCVLGANANPTVPDIIVWGGFNYSGYAVTNVPGSATNTIALAAGYAHCVALESDGTVRAWGSNDVGQASVPIGLTNVVGVAAGNTHSLALKSDGTLVAWGAIWPGSTAIEVPTSATNIAALALGPSAQHALVLRADGTALDWGNSNYELTNIPAAARNLVAVAAGPTWALGLRSDGQVVQWGTQENGASLKPLPTTVSNIVAIACNGSDNLALRADGTILSWPDSAPAIFLHVIDMTCLANDILTLRSDGTLLEWPDNAPAYPTNSITAIAAGSYNGLAAIGNGPPLFCGLPVNRKVASGSRACFRGLAEGSMPIRYQWTCSGTNLPSATNSFLILTNVQPNLAGNPYVLIASNSFGMATNAPIILNEMPSEVYVLGSAEAAVIGQNVTFSASLIGHGPFSYQWQLNGADLMGATNSILALTNVQLSAVGNYSIIVSNLFGSTTNFVSLTVAPTIVTNPIQNHITFPGGFPVFSLGLEATIPVSYQWQFNGTNLFGATNNSLVLENVQSSEAGTYNLIVTDAFECVTNGATLAIVPVAAWGALDEDSLPSGVTNIMAIANGSYHGLALSEGGTVSGWGDNSTGATTIPASLSNVIAIAAGNGCSFALASNGTVVAWGDNAYGQTNVPDGLSNVVALAAGYGHALALKSDGTVATWGHYFYGPTNVPAGLTNIVSIAAGADSSMALRADGEVFAWGYVSNAPAEATNAVEIATGGFDDFILRSDGSMMAWGFDEVGQDSIPPGISNVVAIAMGYAHCAALKTDGTVVAWGDDEFGQTTVPPGLENVIMLRSNGNQNLALLGDSPLTLQISVTNCTRTAGRFQLGIPSQCGNVFALQYKNDLSDGNWTSLPLNAGNGGTLILTDDGAATSLRYYRVLRW